MSPFALELLLFVLLCHGSFPWTCFVWYAAAAAFWDAVTSEQNSIFSLLILGSIPPLYSLDIWHFGAARMPLFLLYHFYLNGHRQAEVSL